MAEEAPLCPDVKAEDGLFRARQLSAAARQIGPGRIAELHQIVHAALPDVLVHFVQGEIRPLIGRDDAEDDLLRSRHHIERRDQAHAPDQSIETDHVSDIVLLVAERVGHQAARFGDELAVQRLQSRALCLAVGVPYLRPLRHPGGGEGREAADHGAGQAREGRDVGWVQGSLAGRV